MSAGIYYHLLLAAGCWIGNKKNSAGGKHPTVASQKEKSPTPTTKVTATSLV